jgi:ATP-binding cassette, subfamily B, bacterial
MQSNDQNLSKSIGIVLKHYWQQVRLNPWLALMSLLLPGAGNILVFYLPTLVVARLLEQINSTSEAIAFSDTIPYILLFAGIWLIGEVVWRFAIQFAIWFETKGMARLNKNALDYLLDKDQKFFSDNFTGSLTKRTIAYSSSFVSLWDVMFFSVFPQLVSMIFAAVILWQFSPWIVLVLFGLVAITLSVLVPLIRRRRRLVRIREELSNKVSGHISDTIINMSAVQAFGHRRQEAKLHHKNVDELVAAAKKSWEYQNLRVDVVVAPLYVLINVLGLVMALTLGKGTGDTAAIFVTFNYFGNVTRILWEFNRIYRNVETALTEAAQFTELLLDEPRIKDPGQPQTSQIIRGSVQFNDVTFHYDDDKTPLFSNLSLKIKPGEKVGLVGHSGGGKTTVTKLLLRFMDIQTGSITIDGQDIRSLKQDDLRSHISYVPQEPLLFHRSLSDNIAYGRPGASLQEIQSIAKLAHAHEFIEKLPKAYETLVGERGVKLSGGQRQRVAIARAMIKNAPILVLDEATSALDSESENLIQDALWKLMENRTAIVIAHRLSTIQRMDRILVMENGTIIEEGSHKELLKKNGPYAKLWAHQSGGFIEE